MCCADMIAPSSTSRLRRTGRMRLARSRADPEIGRGDNQIWRRHPDAEGGEHQRDVQRSAREHIRAGPTALSYSTAQAIPGNRATRRTGTGARPGRSPAMCTVARGRHR